MIRQDLATTHRLEIVLGYEALGFSVLVDWCITLPDRALVAASWQQWISRQAGGRWRAGGLPEAGKP